MKVVLSPNPYRDKGLKAAQARRAGPSQLRGRDGDVPALCPGRRRGGGCPVISASRTPPRSSRPPTCSSALAGTAPSSTRPRTPTSTMCRCWGSIWAAWALWPSWSRVNCPIDIRIAGWRPESTTVEARMMLDVAVRREGKVIYSDLALNDAAVTKGAVARVVDLEVFGDKVLISSFSGRRRGGEHAHWLHGLRYVCRRAPSWSLRRRTSSSLPSVPMRCPPGPLCSARGRTVSVKLGKMAPQDRLPFSRRR